MRSMQLLVFSFDLVMMIYYIFTFPIWDSCKKHMPLFQTDLKTIEKADCSNLMLMIIFVLLSKGMGLGICFVTIQKSIHNIDTISVDYSDV